MTARKSTSGNYSVGYGKPPVHTRFRKGQSGNPSGRASETPAGRAKAFALEEAYRTITVKDGRETVALPAIQAILRRQITLAAKGNGPAQRAVIAAVLALEEEQAQEAAEQAARKLTEDNPTDLIDAARRVCFLLGLARDAEGRLVPLHPEEEEPEEDTESAGHLEKVPAQASTQPGDLAHGKIR